MDFANFSDGILFEKLKQELDALKRKPNNVQDALLAEVAIVNDFTLITADGNLAGVVEKNSGKVITIGELAKK